ncbi:hypothetical protein BABINDRAFT_36838 [Babjeviella inositovora NRRL Y-12698]|uniref:Maintenance of telomere capping protein 6 n=1 Tax=Babjeviella inositovora NRRL Y-12698 TaxID=984486 RepID=A0A1E3QQD2_9ASCO|nr:uncharacterized protein BABINDRAFT_36838 [Babjeviella inositovora NRRL Y-12698]ODQ79903.1 hypothetical protein BABINDRAFT_36838 [Babjeviella inositovora NRRL Y-12698]
MLFFCFAFLSVAADIVNWPQLSNQQLVAQRAQRDVSSNITIDQFGLMGVNLNTVLFDEFGYTSNVLLNVTTLLNVGVLVMEMDLYWNELSLVWQLCPLALDTFNVPLTANQVVRKDNRSITCEASFTFSLLMRTIRSFLDSTNTNLEVNMLQLLFNLKPLQNSTAYSAAYYNYYADPSLSLALNSSLKSSLFTPVDLEEYRQVNTSSNSGFPTWYQFTYYEFDRVIPIVRYNGLPTNSSYNITADFATVFFDKWSLDLSYSAYVTDTANKSISTLLAESFRFISDSDELKFTPNTFLDYIASGYSPIVNHTIQPLSDFALFINYSLWSWSEQELSGKSVVSGYDSDDDTDDYRCATFIESGWSVGLCDTAYQLACRNNNDPQSWSFSTDMYAYLDTKKNDYCPSGTKFSVPQSALEQQALHAAMASQNIAYPIWINLNALSAVDCWVTGGALASCPYQKVISSHDYLAMVTASCVVTFAILALIIGTRFYHVPVQGNRKHWKKIMTRMKEEEFEGVPS